MCLAGSLVVVVAGEEAEVVEGDEVATEVEVVGIEVGAVVAVHSAPTRQTS